MRGGLRLGVVSVLAAAAMVAIGGGASAHVGDAPRDAEDEFADCSIHADEPHNVVTEFGQHATIAAVRVRCRHGHPGGQVIIAAIRPDESDDRRPLAQKFCTIDEDIKEGHEYTCKVAEPRKCDGELQRRHTIGRLGHTGVRGHSTWFSYRCD